MPRIHPLRKDDFPKKKMIINQVYMCQFYSGICYYMDKPQEIELLDTVGFHDPNGKGFRKLLLSD